MPTKDECLCCHELSHQLGPKLGEYTCVTANPVFLSVCLLEDVLETALVCMRETHRDPVHYPIQNKLVTRDFSPYLSYIDFDSMHICFYL